MDQLRNTNQENNIIITFAIISIFSFAVSCSTFTSILRGKEIKQKSLDENFLRDNNRGFKKAVSICLIDKNNLPDPNKRDYYQMRPPITIEHFGLNTKETH